ncbi:TetR/AcrR family transcriptional regulator [Pseudomonas gingeri]|uniref:TetR/AcrR family transcriptional regulator n=2 Tax=Pseudomonas TaxID=286 RepID=A0A7Y8CKY5_9PSED|nr:TetR/AcrR family transcriptional regulator [Pseudomonas gingeri]NVZ99404.1 TetR/AcrR family transcriptional regulator [Pseudomonas gingeri]NWA13449.1 TetR/AcrR family transcriptional regulator [Pseudomonas gingeri]NWA55710.1 TetR/AcrR family transcriptional regulator [Pseudomonas gingeri]NWA95436.1 TetR/AcrR family transcriptional regulator [Pseudomonas gingeri]NWB00523.1 TetR/AcrR family transcriptional regulator [Pseudomonas gingeri]
MKVSREQVAQNRVNILEAASRLFRAKGYEAVTVAEVMKAAGLTHGGFYGYFASKDDLVAQSLAHVFSTSPPAGADVAAYITQYLSSAHLDDCAGGCPMAGLASETSRQAPEARAQMSASIRRQIDRLGKGLPGATAGEKRRAATGNWATMVGAMVLARVCDDPRMADEILKDTRDWLLEKDQLG